MPPPRVPLLEEAGENDCDGGYAEVEDDEDAGLEEVLENADEEGVAV